ncbi:hypothetical protein Tco_0121419 [Tanacetum coccineum]
MVMLKVSPWKGVIRFKKRGKLNQHYVGPFKILAKVRTIAYRIELLKQFSRVHSTFYVSNLKKYLSDETLVIPLDEIQIDDKLYIIKEPIKIMDREVKHLKQSCIPIVIVRWNYKRDPEFMWKRGAFGETKNSQCVSNDFSNTLIDFSNGHIASEQFGSGPELHLMASEQFGSGPKLQLMTPGTISSGLAQNPSPSTPYVQPT